MESKKQFAFLCRRHRALREAVELKWFLEGSRLPCCVSELDSSPCFRALSTAVDSSGEL